MRHTVSTDDLDFEPLDTSMLPKRTRKPRAPFVVNAARVEEVREWLAAKGGYQGKRANAISCKAHKIEEIETKRHTTILDCRGCREAKKAVLTPTVRKHFKYVQLAADLLDKSAKLDVLNIGTPNAPSFIWYMKVTTKRHTRTQ